MDFDYYAEYLTSINIDIILLCQYLEKQIKKYDLNFNSIQASKLFMRF